MKKRIYRIIKYFFIGLFVLVMALILLSQLKPVQNAATQKAVRWFSQKTGTEVILEELRWRKFQKLEIKDFHILDLEGDTLAAIAHGFIEFSPSALFQQHLILRDIEISNAAVHLKSNKASAFNYQFLLDAFPSGDTSSASTPWKITPSRIKLNHVLFDYFDKKTDAQLGTTLDSLTIIFNNLDIQNQQADIKRIALLQPELKYFFNKSSDLNEAPPATDPVVKFPDIGWNLSVNNLNIQNGVIQYREKSNNRANTGFNPQNIAIDGFQLDIDDIGIGQTAISANLKSMALKDHSGLLIKHLSSQIRFAENATELDQFQLQTNHSQINQFLKLTYPGINSLVNITRQNNTETDLPQVKWVIEESYIAPGDINILLPDVVSLSEETPIAIDMDMEGFPAQLFVKHLNINQGTDLKFDGGGRINHLFNNQLLNFDLSIAESKADYQKLQSFLPKGTLPPALESWGVMQLTGRLKGRLSDFQSNNIRLKTATGPQLLCSTRIKGLPDHKSAFFELKVENLETHGNHWSGFAPESLAGFLDSLGSMVLKGTYAGSLTDFRTDLLLQSEIGQLTTDATFNFEQDYADASYNGDLSLKQFDLGKITGDNLLEKVNLTGKVDGKGIRPESWDTQLSAVLSDLTYKDYTYDTLRLDGKLETSVFDGLVSLNDPNISFNYEGMVSLKDSTPAYQFSLQVDTVDFKAIGLQEEPLGLSTSLRLDCSNTSLDQLEGDLVFDYLSINDSTAHYHTDSIIIRSHSDSLQERYLTGQSDLWSFGISGKYELSQLPRIWTTWLDQYFYNSKLFFPEYSGEIPNIIDSLPVTPTNITAYFHLNDPTALTGIFLPELKKLDTVDFRAAFDNSQDTWDIQGQVKDLVYGDFQINDIRLNSFTTNDGIQSILSVDSIQSGENRMLLDSRLSLALRNDSLLIDLSSSTQDSVLSAIGAHITQDSGTLTFRFDEQILAGGDRWSIDKNNQINLSNGQTWNIRGLNFNKQKVHIFIDGQGYLADSTSQANLSFDNFELNDLGMLLGYPDGYLGGILNGQTTMSDIQTNLHYKADLKLQQWTFDNVEIGNLHLKATQLPNQPMIKLAANLDGAGSTIQARGQYDVDQRLFDATAEVKKLEMEVVDPFVKGLIHDSEGYLSGQFNLRGSPDKPILNGTLLLNDLKTVIDYVNTTYKIDSGAILLTEKEIDLGTIQMTDATNLLIAPDGKNRPPKATLSGTVSHQFFDEINMDLRFDTDRFQFLNTTAKDNELFYGSLLLKTAIAITGPVANPVFNINARTEPGTQFFVVPLTEEQAISREDFIVFGQPERDSLGRDTSYLKDYKLTSPGIDLQLNLELTPDAELQVIIDPVTGDKLVCSGSSALTLEMDQAGNVALNGEYNITSGKYTFNYEELLKREFNISQGSNIVFNGDPLQANLDITATYETRVNLTDLVPDYTSTLNQRANVQVKMNIKGDLIKPVLTFDILLPGNAQGSLAEAAKVRLDQIRSDETELNTQVFGLLLFNGFLSSSNNNGTISDAGEAVLLSSVSKLITSQLNNFAGKLIKGVDMTLDVDAYKPTEEGNLNTGVTTEVQLGLSKQIFNDRLAIKVGGNLNVGASRESEEVLTAFTSDFALEYALTPSGNYILRVYRQSDYDAVNEGNVTRTGAGISIKKKFKNKQRKRRK